MKCYFLFKVISDALYIYKLLAINFYSYNTYSRYDMDKRMFKHDLLLCHFIYPYKDLKWAKFKD